MKKKALSVFLAVALLLLCVPLGAVLTARAETTYIEGVFTYSVNNGKAYITGCDMSDGGDVIIPEKLGGYYVSGFGSVFAGNTELISVVIPGTVGCIWEYDFANCTSLQSVVLLDGIEHIMDESFTGCSSLVSITIPDSVIFIGIYAFTKCIAFSDVYYMGTPDQWKEIYCASDVDAAIHFPNCQHIWTEATCTTPAKCTICKDNSSEVPGHSWSEATCTAAKTCTICGVWGGSALGHDWMAPTCTSPQTCLTCGEANGVAAGHSWLSATCTAPKTCSVCGLTESYPLGHTWSAPTCTQAAYCYFCDLTRGEPLGHDYMNGVCIRCGDGSSVVPEPQPPVESGAVLSVGSAVGKAGETVTLKFKLQGAPAIKSLALTGFTYNSEKLEIVGGAWTVENSVIANWDGAKNNAAIAFVDNTDLSGTVFTLTLRIKEGASFETLPVSCQVVAKTMVGDSEVALPMTVTAGSVQVGIRGDIDGNTVLDANDAIHLLYHTLLPDLYPITQDGDVDGSGVVDSNDAVYLLYHVLLPEQYPLG